jgi:hypothetical protein
MKAWSIIGLGFTAAIIATIPISPQVTTSLGLGLSVNQAQAVTYGRARRISRRVDRRSYYGFYGAPGYSSYSGYYSAPGYYYGGSQSVGGGGGQRYAPSYSGYYGTRGYSGYYYGGRQPVGGGGGQRYAW